MLDDLMPEKRVRRPKTPKSAGIPEDRKQLSPESRWERLARMEDDAPYGVLTGGLLSMMVVSSLRRAEREREGGQPEPK